MCSFNIFSDFILWTLNIFRIINSIFLLYYIILFNYIGTDMIYICSIKIVLKVIQKQKHRKRSILHRANL